MNCDNCVGCNNGSSYASLGRYNTPQAGAITGPLVNPRTPPMNPQVVPQYNLPLGYSALTHGLTAEQMTNNHYPITSAYPAYANQCDTFVNRSCSGFVQ